jgi:hypothetical protein
MRMSMHIGRKVAEQLADSIVKMHQDARRAARQIPRCQNLIPTAQERASH